MESLKQLKNIFVEKSKIGKVISQITDIIVTWTNIADKPTEFPPEAHTHDDIYLNIGNTTPFTPDADYEPATKKYVDDNASGLDINSLTEKTTIVDDDIFVIEDSEDSLTKKKVKAVNLPSGGSGDSPTFVFKTSDQSISSSTTLTDDTHLQFALEVGSYHFSAMIRTFAPATPDIKWALHFTGTASAIKYGFTSHHQVGSSFTLNGWTRQDLSALDTALASVQTADTYHLVNLQGFITVTAAGTFSLQFAQNTSNGSAVICFAGSYFMYKKIV